MPVEPENWIEMAKISRQNFYNRRALEWKLAFGVWTGVGLFTAAFFTSGVSALPGWLEWTLGGVYAGLLLVTTVCWQIPLHTAHADDRAWFMYYMDRAQEVSPAEARPRPQSNAKAKWNRRDWSWFIGQCLVTAAFLALSWIAITKVAPTRTSLASKGADIQQKAGGPSQ